MENRKHFRFSFACRDTSECLYDGYFDNDKEMITFAQGLCVGLRRFRSTASVHVYILEKNDPVGRMYRIQR